MLNCIWKQETNGETDVLLIDFVTIYSGLLSLGHKYVVLGHLLKQLILSCSFVHASINIKNRHTLCSFFTSQKYKQILLNWITYIWNNSTHSVVFMSQPIYLQYYLISSLCSCTRAQWITVIKGLKGTHPIIKSIYTWIKMFWIYYVW